MSTALGETLRQQADELARVAAEPLPARVDELRSCRRLWLVGTGSSQHAAELGAMLLEEAGVDAWGVSSIAFVRQRHVPAPDDGVIVISHTGESAYARRARAQAIESGAVTLSVTGQDAGWPEAIRTVPRERSQTYSTSYTTSLLVLAKLAVHLGSAPHLEEAISRVAEAARGALEQPGVEYVLCPPRALVFTGAGPAAVTAREGAVKVREAAHVLGQGYDAEYLLHGSAVPLGPEDHLVLLDPDADDDGLVAAVGDAAAAEGVGTSVVAEVSGLPPLLAQIPLTVRLQVLALRLAEERGVDADTVITGAWAADALWAIGRPESG